MAKDLTQVAIDNIKPGPARREIPDGRARGLFFVVQPSGAKGWALRYRVVGRSRKLTLGAYPAIDLKTARRLASNAIIASGGDPAREKQIALAEARAAKIKADDLVETVVEKFLQRYVKPNLRATSANELDRILTREIVGRWRGRRLSEIRKAHIIDMLDEVMDRGSPVMANRLLAALRRMCAWAIERGLIDASPCAELIALWKAAEAIGWSFGPAVQLMALTGQRRGEIAGMRWDEIDLDAKIWTLPAARAKNNREHVVPLSDAVMAILTALPRVHSREGFVFTLNGAQPVSGFFQAKKRMDALLPAGMPAWTLHDLRRTFASGCARLGIAVHVVEAALNHKSGTIRGVASVYNRYDYASEKRACMQAWARFIETLVSDEPAGNVVELAAAR
jgi:integrase